MNEARVYADGFERSFAEVKESAGVSGRERKKCQMDQKANEYVTAGTTGKGGSKSGCGRCIHGRNFGGYREEYAACTENERRILSGT